MFPNQLSTLHDNQMAHVGFTVNQTLMEKGKTISYPAIIDQSGEFYCVVLRSNL